MTVKNHSRDEEFSLKYDTDEEGSIPGHHSKWALPPPSRCPPTKSKGAPLHHGWAPVPSDHHARRCPRSILGGWCLLQKIELP